MCHLFWKQIALSFFIIFLQFTAISLVIHIPNELFKNKFAVRNTNDDSNQL